VSVEREVRIGVACDLVFQYNRRRGLGASDTRHGYLQAHKGGETVRFTTRQRDGVTIAEASGRLTAGAGAIAFRNQVRSLLDGGVRSIVLDLAGTQMMDSSGLGELVRAKNAAEALGGGVRLLNVGVGARRVMSMAKLLGEFEIFDDEIDAVVSFRP
jgi:anti-anti-sigma factor